MRKIIIFEEPGRDLVFDASSEELRAKASLAVLKRRVTNSNFNYEPTPRRFRPVPSEVEILALTDDQIANLPSIIKDDVAGKKRNLLTRKKLLERELRESIFWKKLLLEVLAMDEEDAIKHTIDTPYKKNINACIWLIKQRSHLYGEGFKILPLIET